MPYNVPYVESPALIFAHGWLFIERGGLYPKMHGFCRHLPNSPRHKAQESKFYHYSYVSVYSVLFRPNMLG